MLKRLFRSRVSKQPTGRSIPAGQRIYAIGDIHGRLDLFRELLRRVLSDDRIQSPADTQIILLGDLVDRGPDSADVIEMVRLLSLSGLKIRCLMGNHEEVMLQAATEPSAEIARFFYKIGGRETLLSYDISASELDAMDWDTLAERIPTLIPQAHIDFLNDLEDMIVIGDYAFVHAGVNPHVPLDKQSKQALRWIREDFLRHEEPLEKTIVYGHTIYDHVEHGPGRIGLDTGAYKSGILTAIALEDGQQRFFDTAQLELEAAE